MTKPKITRYVETKIIGNESVSAEIPEDSDELTLVVTDGYTTLEVKMSRQDFLDFVVACWPDNVAYQFPPDQDIPF